MHGGRLKLPSQTSPATAMRLEIAHHANVPLVVQIRSAAVSHSYGQLLDFSGAKRAAMIGHRTGQARYSLGDIQTVQPILRPPFARECEDIPRRCE